MKNGEGEETSLRSQDLQQKSITPRHVSRRLGYSRYPEVARYQPKYSFHPSFVFVHVQPAPYPILEFTQEQRGSPDSEISQGNHTSPLKNHTTLGHTQPKSHYINVSLLTNPKSSRSNTSIPQHCQILTHIEPLTSLPHPSTCPHLWIHLSPVGSRRIEDEYDKH